MSISSIDRGAVLSREMDGLSSSTDASTVNRDMAGLVRILDQTEVSEMVAGSRPPAELLPAPELPDQLDEVIATATSTLSRIDAKDVATDLYSIMALMLQVYQSERTANREVRQSGYQIQAADQYAAADKMRNAAEARMWGSIFSAGAQVAGGALTLGGGVASGVMSIKAAGLSNEAAQKLADGEAAGAKALEALATKWSGSAQMVSSTTGGLSSVVTGAGSLANALKEKSATELDAEKMDLQTTSGKQEQMTQEVNERMQQLLDAIRDVLEKMRSIEQSRTEINRGIARSL